MTAGFSLRKIKTPQTLGTRFKRARRRKKIGMIDAELSTKIRSKYLYALETDDWLNLPADTYTKGFVIRYAKFLGLDLKTILSQYQRERQAYSKKSDDLLIPHRNIREKNLIITPKLMIPSIIGVFVLSVFSYIIIQVYSFAAAPELQITYPQNSEIVDNETIELKGVTDKEATLLVNEHQIQVSSDGKFVAEYKLSKGVNTIEVKAKNKAEKEKTEVLVVEYKPQTAQANN